MLNFFTTQAQMTQNSMRQGPRPAADLTPSPSPKAEGSSRALRMLLSSHQAINAFRFRPKLGG